MLVSVYDNFVQASDRSIGKPSEERLDIATYGLASEIGSVVAAIKKRLLAEGGVEDWNHANEEIIEELGDVIWYCFSLARSANRKRPINIFALDIVNLKREIGADNARADRIRGVLDKSKRTEFLKAAKRFPKKTKSMAFEDYQRVAFLTARTEDRTLVEVCLAVLWQLSAQLFRRKLSPLERELNHALVDKSINDILGEIAWHIAALASIYKLQLSDIAQRNVEKVSHRLDRRHPTPHHDQRFPTSEQFPRRFEVAFVTFTKGRSRMYLDDRRLGDDLTDNAYDDDGYRYHDIMHLANVAKLGWSPVFRGLMGRKRKSVEVTDEVEDGARAKIVEEAVIKAIHSEGQRLAALRGYAPSSQPLRLFSKSSDITFRFLKLIRSFVSDLEVHKNRDWEWEEAILDGHKIFHLLRCEGQGTVIVDLDARSIVFKPEVCVCLDGRVAGLGSAFLECSLPGARGVSEDETAKFRSTAQRLAILDSLGMHQPTALDLETLQIKSIEGKGISVKATGSTQSAMWARKIVAFRTTIATTSSGSLHCMAIALADD